MYRQRHDERAPIHKRMAEVHRVYDGRYTIPLPEMDKNERPAVANILAMGVDQIARRIASVVPAISSDPTSFNTQAATDRARSRVLAANGWWKMNDVKAKRYRRGRFMAAYGASPVVISPVSLSGDDRKIPYLHVKDPMTAYPAECADYDDIEPENCIFCTERPLTWLIQQYPEAMTVLRKGSDRSGTIRVLEYMDAEVTVLVAIANETGTGAFRAQMDGGATEVELARAENRCGICPVVFPGRITLGKAVGQFMQTLGVMERQAKLDALTDIAVFRNVFPEKWLESLPNAPGLAKIEVVAEPRQGVIGEISNGHLNIVRPVPNQEAQLREDQLERAARLNGNVPSELGGESSTNIRTGRRGEIVLGEALDLLLQEYHDIDQRSAEAELRRMVEVQLHYFPKPTKYVLLPGEKVGRPDYTPSDIWDEQKALCVEYPMPGMDASAMTVALGQKVGMGTISRKTAMFLDPTVRDPDTEYARVEEEGLADALKQGLQQQIIGGQMLPQTAGRIGQLLISERLNIFDAVVEAHKELQQEQAQQQAQQPQPQQPGQGAPPEEQPGLQAPANPPPSVAAPQPGAQNLMQMLQTLHAPQGANAFAGAGAPAQ